MDVKALPCLGGLAFLHELKEACYTMCMRCWCLSASLSMSLLRSQLPCWKALL